ncbi:sigma-70 family RNA polymerase sigma factor [Aquimarina sp. 2201CG5-10]|uniref:RNA polymerase sigma factor n=1 Tax=Aquimarina callyspongiae TaxID=3098150 RepID=UPI002AB5355C|nr:sigma-70 family RNA polymerase sigma factor [Aquimarina sp. 2201CG5-10]MDY8134898.1 sigma-70 family RNA polymerase sigma factor [Aquimarina sp. 2201CG5-10]
MQSEDRFIKALIQGDDIIISEIYTRFFAKTLRFVLQNKGTHDQARDIFQESLLYIIIGVQKRNLNINCFEAYLMTVSKNMWRRELEKQKKRVIKEGITTLVDKDTDFAMFMLEQEQMQLYREKFEKLSDNCKEILSLFFNDVSYENIIEELSYANINTARQRIFKCKSKLIKLIKSDTRFK